MSEQRQLQVQMARAALILAARRRTLVTYKELGLAIGMSGVELPHHMKHVLNDLSNDCLARGEHSLAALVVNQETGAPGAGFDEGDHPWHAEVAKCFKHWGK